MREFDAQALAEYNGQDGKPVYIAYQGKVYDVSASKMWRGGKHMQRHQAGRDLSTDFQAAPHGEEVLDRYPQVGVLEEQKLPEMDIPPLLEQILKRYPMLRRHPHPMTVHFPIAFMLAYTVFNVVYLLTGVKSFELTALHCLGAGILFAGVAISTGWYTWWLNYMAQPIRAVAVKKPLSLFMLCLAVILFIWRLLSPDILERFNAASLVYVILVLAFAPMITVIGWFGASLTFPVEKE